MEQGLLSFLDIHKGETAWIFGKGPSLNGFNFDDAGPLRCGINDLVGLVPDCVYGFSNDRPHDWSDLYERHHTLFIPKRTADYCDVLPDCNVVVFEDYHGHDLVRDKEAMCDELQIREGSIGSAMQILYIMGVRKIIAVGIDGGGKHSTRNRWRTALKNEHYKEYNRIRAAFIEGCEQLGIELQFFTGSDNQMADGYRTVQFSGNCFVRGNPYESGMVIKLKEEDAKQVIYAGRGHIVPDVVKKNNLRTATVKKAVETPEKRTAKKTAKKATRKR